MPKKQDANSPKSILIVDDMEHNRAILRELIRLLGYRPVEAENGKEALEIIQSANPPDLVLLDMIMPEMDGYTVLEKMKQDKILCHIPVLIISATNEIDNILRCIALGADDYIIKPFSIELLKARITPCMQKKRLHDQTVAYNQLLENYNHQLGKEVQKKTAELAEANEKLKILDEAKAAFLRLIAHELRTPLNGVFAVGELLLASYPKDSAINEIKDIYRESSCRLEKIIDQALFLSELQISSHKSWAMEPNQLRLVLAESTALAAPFAASLNTTISEIPPVNSIVLGEHALLVKAISELLETAAKFSRPGTVIQLKIEPLENEVMLSIRASGQTIPEKDLPKFFEVFSISDPIVPGNDLGLSAPMAERILKLSGGSITVENCEPPGILFKAKLKQATNTVNP